MPVSCETYYYAASGQFLNIRPRTHACAHMLGLPCSCHSGEIATSPALHCCSCASPFGARFWSVPNRNSVLAISAVITVVIAVCILILLEVYALRCSERDPAGAMRYFERAVDKLPAREEAAINLNTSRSYASGPFPGLFIY